jgi:hypothetical protein
LSAPTTTSWLAETPLGHEREVRVEHQFAVDKLGTKTDEQIVAVSLVGQRVTRWRGYGATYAEALTCLKELIYDNNVVNDPGRVLM